MVEGAFGSTNYTNYHELLFCGTVGGRCVCILRLQRCGVCLNPRSRPWVIRSGLPAAARTRDGGGGFLLAYLRHAMGCVGHSAAPGLRTLRLPRPMYCYPLRGIN